MGGLHQDLDVRRHAGKAEAAVGRAHAREIANELTGRTAVRGCERHAGALQCGAVRRRDGALERAAAPQREILGYLAELRSHDDMRLGLVARRRVAGRTHADVVLPWPYAEHGVLPARVAHARELPRPAPAARIAVHERNARVGHGASPIGRDPTDDRATGGQAPLDARRLARRHAHAAHGGEVHLVVALVALGMCREQDDRSCVHVGQHERAGLVRHGRHRRESGDRPREDGDLAVGHAGARLVVEDEALDASAAGELPVERTHLAAHLDVAHSGCMSFGPGLEGIAHAGNQRVDAVRAVGAGLDLDPIEAQHPAAGHGRGDHPSADEPVAVRVGHTSFEPCARVHHDAHGAAVLVHRHEHALLEARGIPGRADAQDIAPRRHVFDAETTVLVHATAGQRAHRSFEFEQGTPQVERPAATRVAQHLHGGTAHGTPLGIDDLAGE